MYDVLNMQLLLLKSQQHVNEILIGKSIVFIKMMIKTTSKMIYWRRSVQFKPKKKQRFIYSWVISEWSVMFNEENDVENGFSIFFKIIITDIKWHHITMNHLCSRSSIVKFCPLISTDLKKIINTSPISMKFIHKQCKYHLHGLCFRCGF